MSVLTCVRAWVHVCVRVCAPYLCTHNVQLQLQIGMFKLNKLLCYSITGRGVSDAQTETETRHR